eukprot:jgi/Tetstr1/448044/TSEL_035344.t1
MVDAGKAAAVGGGETYATAKERVEAGRRAVDDDKRMAQLIQELFSGFFVSKDSNAAGAASEEDAIPGGNASRAGGKDQIVRATFAPPS